MIDRDSHYLDGLRARAMTTTALAAAVLLLGACAGGVLDTHASAELIRTEGGIVHVSANDFTGLGFGIAYAYAQDNVCMLADHLLTVRGERSRYFGPDATATRGENGEYSAQVQYTVGFKNLDSDLFYRAYLDPQALSADYRSVSPDANQLVRGYAAGYNAYLREHRDTLPAVCRNAAWVKPMSVADAQRLIAEKAIHATGEFFRNEVLAAVPPAGNLPVEKADKQAPLDPQPLNVARDALVERLHESRLGSNGLAVGSELSDSGSGLLLGNPHFPWSGPDRFYEMHLTVPGRYDAMGATLGGLPIIVIGFNKDVAWTHTVSTAKHFALYRLALDPADLSHRTYLLDGHAEPIRQKDVNVDVLQADGSIKTVQRAFYFTPVGMLVASKTLGLQWDAQHAYVLADVNRDNTRMLDHWLAIGRASGVQGVEQADRQFVGLPWVNTLAVDRAGHALFEDYSAVPNLGRASQTPGCLLDPRILLLDGSRVVCGGIALTQTAQVALEAQPATNAGGVFAWNLPQQRRPYLQRSDFVANSNDSYWLANPAAPISKIPPWFGKEGAGAVQSLRTRLAFEEIQARAAGRDGLPGNRFSFDAFAQMLFDARVYAADLLRKPLVDTCRAAHDATLEPVCATLANWNGKSSPDSAGAPLFRAAWLHLSEIPNLWAVPFDPQQPMTTPSGLNPAAAPAVQAALRAAGADLRAAGIPLDATLARLQFTRVGPQDIPLTGGPGEEGIYDVVSASTKYDKHLFGEVAFGTSYVQMVGFNGQGPVARAVLTYDQSTDPTSPYYGRQTELFARHGWIDLPFTRDAVLAHAQGTPLQVGQ
ncbi:penicillin acylase family protein [Caballeronia sp. SEWSISQ10-4 2]|uniref:penicillin acylase family protein n=1 Tax=Caballeronia sp. SEWSISQ10-4 2 TaxID=2937438 RepID=UPI00265230AD|nr:penicillin acylase family protein [Caballeronia sp. SEWSISQ10-4 2]MDN7183623.1 penicillin acylase family protein [Caballeronia sp. SEWSISQ10-4 2]